MKQHKTEDFLAVFLKLCCLRDVDSTELNIEWEF